MVYEYKDFESLEKFDYYLEEYVVVRVDEHGSDNEYEAEIQEFVEKDVADGVDHAKVYKGEVTEVHNGEYDVGDKVRIDNRDVVIIYD